MTVERGDTTLVTDMITAARITRYNVFVYFAVGVGISRALAHEITVTPTRYWHCLDDECWKPEGE